MRRVRTWRLAASASILAGCSSSAPVRFYTLSAVPAGAEQQRLAPPPKLGRVSIPAELDRVEIVRRIDANRLAIEEGDHWAAPLPEMVKRVLTADLEARLGRDPGTVNGTRINVDITDLTMSSGCRMALAARWSTETSEGASISHLESLESSPRTTCDASAVPAAMSDALGQLSDRIATALASAP